MASDFTNLGIELIGSGEQSSTWGQTTNDNLEMLDNALSQRKAVIMPDTDLTITAGPGETPSKARAAFLSVEGALSENRVLTIAPSDMQKFYFIENKTTAISEGDSHDIIVAQGDGGLDDGVEDPEEEGYLVRSVRVSPGVIVQVFCDGDGTPATVIKLGSYGVGGGNEFVSQFFVAAGDMYPAPGESGANPGSPGGYNKLGVMVNDNGNNSLADPWHPSVISFTGTRDRSYQVWECANDQHELVSFDIILPRDWDGAEMRYSSIFSLKDDGQIAGKVNTQLLMVTMNDGVSLTAESDSNQVDNLCDCPEFEKVYHAERSLAFPIDKASAGDLVHFTFRRDTSGGQDTAEAVAYLHGIMFYYNDSAA